MMTVFRAIADGFDDRFRSASPWTAPNAVFASMAILLVAVGVAGATGTFVISAIERWSRNAAGTPGHYMSDTNGMAVLAVMQIVIVGLVWRLSGWFGGNRREVLSLTRPLDRRLFLTGLFGMALLLLPYNFAIYALWPDDFTKDLRPFAQLARSPAAWLAALVVTVGAPFSEEFLFRGFLLAALARATARMFLGLALALLLLQIGLHVGAPLFLRVQLPALPLVFGMNLVLLVTAAIVVAARMLGATPHATATPADGVDGTSTAVAAPVSPLSFALAALFTTAGWTVMHAYSMIGVIEVFLIGLYFCWLVWRTGNLWLTIALHAFYNGVQFLVLTLVPLPAAIPG